MLSFEFGLLWPTLMDRFGAAFGLPFAVEGLFFFLEAIFIGIYIYGWDRLPPRLHWWAGVPIVIAGIGGSISVVAANAWMQQPGGFTLGPDGRVAEVDPAAVFFNRAMPLQATHMVIAAYLVGGFLVASVYAAGMLRGRRDAYHRLGFLIPFTVGAIAVPVQFVVGDQLARFVYRHEPVKFAAMELVHETGTNVPEVLGGWMSPDGTVRGGLHIPGLASWLSDPARGTSTEIRGLTAVAPRDRPTTWEVNVVHLAWDAMLGAATFLLVLSAWFAWSWWRRRDLPPSRWFLRAAAASGVVAVVAMEAGWVVTEVGRQPWVVHGYLRVADAATSHRGIWVTFWVVTAVYLALGVVLVRVLRGMSARWRRAAAEPAAGLPYGPRPPLAGAGSTQEQAGAGW